MQTNDGLAWEEVLFHVRSRYAVTNETAGWIGMNDRPGGPGVGLELMTAFGRPWIRLVALVCDSASMVLSAALAHNDTLVVGALAVNGDRCYLRHAMALDVIALGDLDTVIAYLASEAVDLRRRCGRPIPLTLFEAFSD